MKRIFTTTALVTLIAGAASAQDMIGTDGVTISGNDVTIANVTASQDGYIVLHAVKDGAVVAPASIGHTAIKAGENANVTVTSDEPLTEGTSFVAMLHVEEDGMSMDGMMMPMIDTAGVKIDGATATFANVAADKDGYLVIHTMLDGAPVVPASIGHVAVKAGENPDVAVKIDYDFVKGEKYFAMLHEETNGNTSYDFGAGKTDVDTPAMSGGKVVGVAFDG